MTIRRASPTSTPDVGREYGGDGPRQVEPAALRSSDRRLQCSIGALRPHGNRTLVRPVGCVRGLGEARQD